MKRTTALIVAALLSIGATVAFAGMDPQTGVNGSVHDIGWQTGKGYVADNYQRVCIYCHTPHNATQANALDPVPLWNRAETSATLTPYVWSAPGNLALSASDPLLGPSRLCLSCHDGTTAADSHGPAGIGTAQANTGSQVISIASGRAWTDLTGTHPIGFSYDDAFALRKSAELVDPSTGEFVDTIAATNNTFDRSAWTNSGATRKNVKKIADTLYDHNVTCASCHDVHNTNNATNPPVNGAAAPNYFVWASEKGSALCLSCHVK